MTAKTKLICVGPQDVERTWPLVASMIAAAYAETDLIMPDVRQWLLEGKGLLWLAVDGDNVHAAMTTSLEPRRSGLACRMVAMGGAGIELWKDHVAEIEDYARAEGCVKVTCDGRRGWERVLTGYLPKSVSLERAL